MLTFYLCDIRMEPKTIRGNHIDETPERYYDRKLSLPIVFA